MSDLEQRASVFLLRREEPGWSGEDERELAAWLAQSDRHKAVFWRLEHGWSAADRVAALGAGPTRLMRTRAALAGFTRRAGIALAASVLPIALGLAFVGSGEDAPRYKQFATEKGERKILNFPDGTRIELNTATRIRVAMGEEDRRVLLDRGEAFFEVTHDAKRPFHVRIGNHQVTDLGTTFVIRRDGDATLTAVLDGEVQLGRIVEGRVQEKLLLKPGDRAVAKGRTTFAYYDDMDGVEDMIGWRRGLIIFNRVPLAKAAAEFNRYSARKLVIEDPEVASIKIGGSFRPDNIDGFARLMSDAYRLKVTRSESEIKISRK